MKKIRIQRVSRVSMLLALLLAAVLTAVSVARFRTFQSMRSATTRYVTAERCAEKLQKGSDTLTNQTDGCPALTMSAGIAFSGGDTPEADIYQRADNALYYIKQHGRNGAWFYGD